MEPESVGEFALRLHGLGAPQKQQPVPNQKSDPIGYLASLVQESPHDLYRSLLTNEPTENIKQSLFRGAPSGIGATLGGMVGGAAGGAASLGLGTVPGAYAGMAVGGAGGEFLRQGLVGINSAFGNTQAPEASQVGLSGLREGTVNAAVPMVAKPLVKLAGKTITGMSGMTMDRLMERPSQVATSAMLNPEAAPNLAKQFVDAVNNNMDRAGDAYKTLIDSAVKNKAVSINLKDSLSGLVDGIRQDFGYGLPGRLAEEGDAKLFAKFANGLNSMGSATAEEAYYFQRDLTNAIRGNAGKPIAAALGRLKSGVMDTLGQSMPEIGVANNIYRSASELSDELSKVTNADSALSAIKSALKNRGNTFDALGKSADQVANGRQLLEAIKDAMAGGELSPGLAAIPRTGFATGLGMLGYKAGLEQNPLAQSAATVMAPFLSPRTVAYGTRAAMSTPGQLAERPTISALVNQLMQGFQPKEKKPMPIESVGDFALRLHGL